jgi:rubrerythrin
MAERAPADSELANLFFELADVEWKHKTDLQTEYESTMNDPEQFLRDM